MKKTLRILLFAIVAGALVFFGLNLLAQYKVKSIIKEKTAANHLSYKTLELDLWKGNIRFDSVYYHDNKRIVKANYVAAQKIEVLDILLGKSIDVRNLKVDKPSIELFVISQDFKKNRTRRNEILDKEIHVDTLSITGLNLNLKRDSLDKIRLKNYDIYFEGLRLEDIDFEEDLPFQFEKGIVKGEEFYFNTAKQSVAGSKIEMSKSDLRISDIILSANSDNEASDRDISPESKLDLRLKEFLVQDYKIKFKADKPELYGRKISLNNINGQLLKVAKTNDAKKETEAIELPLDFKIDTFSIKDANWRVDGIDRQDTVVKTSIHGLSTQLYDVSSIIAPKSKLPFSFYQVDIRAGKILHELNDLQQLETDSLRFENKAAKIYGLKILPKFPRHTYRYYIAHERDLMDVKLDKIEIPEYDLVSQEGSRFYVPRVLMSDFDMKVYRDKRAKNDFTKKVLYSKMLRELSVKFTIDTLQLKRGNIAYEEVQEKNDQTGKVFFTDMSFDIFNLSNEDLDRAEFPETHFSANGYFMGRSPISVDWKFKVNDVRDRFVIVGNVRDVTPTGINSFLTPAFNVQAKGKGIDHLYFNFHGDDIAAQGNFKIEYQNLRFDVLRKRDGKKSKFLSFAANLIVPKKRTEKDKEVDIPPVERDDTKSFWNYLWKCVSTGLMHTVI